MRSPLPTALATAALATVLTAAIACADGALATRPLAPCAATEAAARLPLAAADLAGDWWAEGDLPPTLHLAGDADAMRGDLAFSGVARPGGTGTVSDACLRLTFPAPPGTTAAPMRLEGALVGEGRMRVTIDGAGTFVLVRRS